MTVVGTQPDRVEDRGRVDLLAECGLLLKDRRIRAVAVAADPHRLDAGVRLLAVLDLGLAALERDRHRGAERRVACERDLLGRRPDPVAVVGDVGALHEGGLDEAGLLREGEHHLIAHGVRVVHDREAIAGQRLVGEDVEQGVGMRAQNSATPSSGVEA
jgi:hypothetical protein